MSAPIEIERKFFVASDGWRAHVTGAHELVQGYLPSDGALSVRVRLYDGRGLLTLKCREAGAALLEFEYKIPRDHAELLLRDFCRARLIEKRRHDVVWEGRIWCVDVFTGARDGLVLAEAELRAADEALSLPPWIGEEVTGDPAYRNEAL